MTKPYKITRLSEGRVYAREVNPYGEKEPDQRQFETYAAWYEHMGKWRYAEIYLQEYPLSEESAKKLIMDYNCAAINDSVQPKLIGQVITGTLINEEIHI
jgi:hypothetical protein